VKTGTARCSRRKFIDFENQSRLSAGLLFGFVNGVAFLPQKFGRAQNKRGRIPIARRWPTDLEESGDRGTIDPFRVTRADDCL